MNTVFACPECHKPLIQRDEIVTCSSGHVFQFRNNVAVFLPAAMNAVTRGDAEYHESVKEEWLERNQVNTYRNIRYHDQVLEDIVVVAKSGGLVLELGGGVGFDCQRFIRKNPGTFKYVFSEISQAMCEYAADSIKATSEGIEESVNFASIDVSRLPFADGDVDVIFMIAALHHFPDLDRAFSEMCRVLSQDGAIVCGIEPNKNMVGLLEALKAPVKTKLSLGSSSPADEEAEGFSISDFFAMARKYDLTVSKLQPVWFLSGFVHYCLELLFRLFKLKQRYQLPKWIDKAIVSMDELLLALPGMRHLAWHYSVVFQRQPKRTSSL